MNKEKILVDGLFSYDIPDTAPDFVLGKTAYNLSKFIKFLQDNQQFAVNGFLTVQTLRSKTGKRYAVLDTYEYDKRQNQLSQPQNATQNSVNTQPETYSTPQGNYAYNPQTGNSDFVPQKELPVTQQDKPDDMPVGWDDPNSENYIPF